MSYTEILRSAANTLGWSTRFSTIWHFHRLVDFWGFFAGEMCFLGGIVESFSFQYFFRERGEDFSGAQGI